MAKKRFFGRKTRRYARKAVRSVRRRVGGSPSKLQLVQIDSMAYGAIRAPVSNAIASVVPIPVVGTIGDEIAMGLVDYLVAKNTGGMLRNIALKGLVIENARLGEAAAGLALGNKGGSVGGSSTW